jgi:hypothetical protein
LLSQPAFYTPQVAISSPARQLARDGHPQDIITNSEITMNQFHFIPKSTNCGPLCQEEETTVHLANMLKVNRGLKVNSIIRGTMLKKNITNNQ